MSLLEIVGAAALYVLAVLAITFAGMPIVARLGRDMELAGLIFMVAWAIGFPAVSLAGGLVYLIFQIGRASA